MVKNLKLKQAASKSKKQKYRSIINSLLLRLKRRLDDRQKDLAEKQSKIHLEAVATVVSNYIDKNQAKEFCRDLFTACPDLKKKVRAKHEKGKGNDVDIKELIVDVVNVEPELETKYQIIERLVKDYNRRK